MSKLTGKTVKFYLSNLVGCFTPCRTKNGIPILPLCHHNKTDILYVHVFTNEYKANITLIEIAAQTGFMPEGIAEITDAKEFINIIIKNNEKSIKEIHVAYYDKDNEYIDIDPKSIIHEGE